MGSAASLLIYGRMCDPCDRKGKKSKLSRSVLGIKTESLIGD